MVQSLLLATLLGDLLGGSLLGGLLGGGLLGDLLGGGLLGGGLGDFLGSSSFLCKGMLLAPSKFSFVPCHMVVVVTGVIMAVGLIGDGARCSTQGMSV